MAGWHARPALLTLLLVTQHLQMSEALENPLNSCSVFLCTLPMLTPYSKQDPSCMPPPNPMALP